MTADHDVADAPLDAIESALRKGVAVFVSGPSGSGRRAVLRSLAEQHRDALVLDLLSLSDADAPAVAMLEARAAMGWSNDAELDQDGLYEFARSIGRELDLKDRLLVLKVPADWWRIARADESDDRVLAMGDAVLRGLTATRGPVVVIADQVANRRTLLPGKPYVVELPLRQVTLDRMDQVTSWGALRPHADALRAHAHAAACSMVGWRLAVGLVATGEAPEDVVAGLHAGASALAERLATRMAESPQGRRVLERVAALRVPVTRDALPGVLGVDPPWIDIASECVGYGDEQVRVAPEVRSACERAVSALGGVTPEAHHALAGFHRALDGASSARALSQAGVRQWAEKVHHLGASGALGFDEWRAQTMPGPQFYWDRGRSLSWRGEYARAAETYRACVERFPDDDYGWHYLAFNLERAAGPSSAAEEAFRRARALSPNNAWWNGRLVSHLIHSGKPSEARGAWENAVRSVLSEEDGRCRDAITALELHRWVAKAWLDAGRAVDAREVLESVDAEVLRSEHALDELLRRAKDAAETGGAAWQRFLSNGATESDASPEAFARLRAFWDASRARMGERLPLPIVEVVDGELRCTWSYARVRLQADLYEDGTVGWYARDHRTGESAAGDEDPGEVGDALATWLQRVIDA